ncbi:TadE/TadG family type IV pilus assembly protein [Rugamonas sp. CCM 8940]|uniref:TadE/TadG family type IV pilus assembly protein n=1 Tax=Rugamonas sp. CCM 8940 TaxID=2765359 RepID=UPI0018F76DD9|nr:TadE family protein [Rugamonas sp. CCM 8940]MBJ7309511.1 pilus assembly protein [Rugamonas sp. CCM 8940]
MRPPPPARRPQRGIAAVELALVLAMGLAVVPTVVVLGRALHAYTVMQKAVHDAARYLSAVPAAEMATQSSAFAAVALAQSMVVQAAASSPVSPPLVTPLVAVTCDGVPCGSAVPAVIQVSVAEFNVADPLTNLTYQVLLQNGFKLQAVAVMRYGN